MFQLADRNLKSEPKGECTRSLKVSDKVREVERKPA